MKFKVSSVYLSIIINMIKPRDNHKSIYTLNYTLKINPQNISSCIVLMFLNVLYLLCLYEISYKIKHNLRNQFFFLIFSSISHEITITHNQ